MIAVSTASSARASGALQEDQEFGVLLASERRDGILVFAEHRVDIGRRTIPAPNPHHTGNRTGDLAALLKIRILGDYSKATLKRVTLYGFISRAVKPYREDVQ